MSLAKQIISVIMGGGRGTRLYPLTMERCKPAVPLAGKYRLGLMPIIPDPQASHRHLELATAIASGDAPTAVTACLDIVLQSAEELGNSSPQPRG